MIRIVFILISISGGVYFSIARRQFDFFSIGFLSACVFFLPGFVGYALFPNGYNEFRVSQRSELLEETYLVMIAVLFTILIGAFIFDLLVKRRKIIFSFNKDKYVAHIAASLAILGFVVTVIISGPVLLSPNKSALLEDLTRWHIIWVASASIGALISYLQNKKKLIILCLVLLSIDMFIGFRMSFALVLISLVVITFSKKGKIRVIIEQKVNLLFFGIGAFFIFVYKRFYIVIKTWDWDLIVSQIKNKSVYIDSILESEPFTTQVILNEIIRTNFHVTGEHFISLLNQFLLFSPSFGLKNVSFNSLFQPALFPYVNSGMANNIWAEMWSSGGWFLLIPFIILFVSGLFFGSYLLRIDDPVIKGGVVLFFSYWAFYIHRNDIGFQITLEKRVLLVWLFCLFVSTFLLTILSVKRKRNYIE